jgi:hypothetical protein
MNFNIVDIFNYLGINLNDPSIPPIVLLSLSVFILCSVALLSFLNILFYFLVLFFIDTEFIKNKIQN